ncbi:MAG: twin-arginine translocase subunit TatC, partial [Gemmatimonadales bacterium]
MLSPTEPVMIVLKLGFIIGLVLASPVLIWQVWAFMAPALYQKEKRAIVPALFIGLLLFLGGAAVGYLIVVPQALQVLFSFQNEALAPVITYDAWFGFVLQVVLALGISFELPLVIIVLASLGVVDPPMLARFRRYALVLACLAGALLSPGADVLSMIMMTVPLIFLYEVGYLGAVVIARRRRKAAARAGPIAGVILFLLLAGAGAVDAQVVKRPPKAARDTVALPDTLRPAGALDSAQAARLGLPTAPTRPFPEPDSIMQSLISRTGYQMIRYQADSATLYAEEKRILLEGEAATESRGSVLEANRIMYVDEECMLVASGDLRMFDEGSVVVGDSIRYNSCRERSIVTDALTNFTEGSTVWFLRGNVAQDSSTKRVYASSGQFTSCDLPVSHYHFQAGEVKWISKTMIVARPAILYIRDVPIMWLPFIFQDTRPGRRSGILIPQFGINDIVRPNPGYNRQVTNLGYYWAPSEYFDLTARMDWYANRFVQFGLAGQYRVLDRFLSGNININRQQENTGGRATSFRWDHRQSFGLSTTLNFNVNYVTNTSIVQRNAIDPILSTQQITSSLNFTRRFGWGALALGGNRRQNLNDESSSTQFPALTITPKPIDLSGNITWSPALSFTNDLTSNSPQGSLLLVNAAGGIDTVLRTADSRTT